MRNNFLRDCTTGGVGGLVGRNDSGTGGGGPCFGKFTFGAGRVCCDGSGASIDLGLGGACLMIFATGVEDACSGVSAFDTGCGGGGGGAARVGFGGDLSEDEDGGNEGLEGIDETGPDGCDAAWCSIVNVEMNPV
jgi:hypothetical protein